MVGVEPRGKTCAQLDFLWRPHSACLCSPAHSNNRPARPRDLAYCAKLSQIYQRYVGANASSPSMAGGTPDVAGGEALAKCREGDAKASIPTLERLLEDADLPLPKRT